MTEEIKVGDTVRLLIQLGGQVGRVAEVVEVFEREGLKSYDVASNGMITGVAAYEVEKIAAVQEVVSTLEELYELPEETTIWASSNDGTQSFPAGTGNPYLRIRDENVNALRGFWWDYSAKEARLHSQIQLPAIVVYKPVAETTETVKDAD